MAVITLPEAQAWLETTKLTLAALDAELEGAVRVIVFGKVSSAYDTSGWTSTTNTPELIRKAVAMYYAGAYYTRQYSEEDPDGLPYGKWLMEMADTLLAGIVDGSIDLPEVPTPTTSAGPSFYPDDTVGVLCPEEAARFTMGKVF